MKKFLAAFLSLFVLAGCSANNDEVNEVASSYLESTLSYNFTEGRKYATGEALEAMNLVESYLAYSKMAATVQNVNILDTDVSDGYAKVQAQIIRDIQSEEITESENRIILVELIELNGQWLVYDSTVLKMGL